MSRLKPCGRDTRESHGVGPVECLNDSLVDRLDLKSHLWRFGRTSGSEITERLRFIPDGRLLGSRSDNERFWRLHDGKLDLIAASGTVTTTFTATETIRGRRTLIGTYLPNPTTRHTLAPNFDDMHTVQWLRRPSAPLLVIINSMGAAFDGSDTTWIATHITKRHAHDYVRVSERADPHFWYLNKTRRIMRMLETLVSAGYREFYIYGQSSGGFAALYFGEMIAAAHPYCRVRTAAINPQTVHGQPYDAAAHARVLPGDGYAFITPDALAQADTEITDIPTLVRSLGVARGDAQHRVIFDALNPADAFYASQLDGLSGFDLMPQDLGRHHSDGITHMRQSALFDDALAWGMGDR